MQRCTPATQKVAFGMSFIGRIMSSFGRCDESVQFSMIRASMADEGSSSNFWGVSVNENMHRMRTMARLHESLFRVQMEIRQYDERYEVLQRQAEAAFYKNASESQQRDDFNKMRLVELQKNAIQKASHVLLFTLNGLEQKGCIQNINSIIQFTVKEHDMIHKEGLIDDNENESLVDAYDKILNQVSQGHDVLETLDAHSSNIENDQESEENAVDNDSAFGKWQLKMSQKKMGVGAQPAPISAPAVNVIYNPPAILQTPSCTNTQQQTYAAPPNTSNPSRAMTHAI